MKLIELARLTDAQVEGATDIEITGAAGLDIAMSGEITFLANLRYKSQVESTRASAIFLGEAVEIGNDIAVLRVRDPYLAYTRTLRIFHPDQLAQLGL